MKSSNEILQKWASIIQADSPELVDDLDNVPVSVAQTITAKTYNLTMFQDATSSPLETVPASVSTIDETVFRENTFHSQDTVTNVSQSITLETHRPHSFPIPILERYDINKQIGKGGMGTIYRALQLDLQRNIAIKIPNTTNLYRRFIEEAIVTAYLNHSNIIPVHDLITDKNGASMVMQLIEGQPWNLLIEEIHREHPINLPDDVFDIEFERFIKTCEAVEYSHSKGILHNDIKSENIMVGAYGDLLLMDWGCATTSNHVPNPTITVLDATSLTGPFGTPMYMSPEQGRGNGTDIGPWSDIYLLGGVLFELLEGKPPRGNGSLEDVLQKAIDGIYDPFEKQHYPYLQRIARKCLASNHNERYQTVKELLDDLRDFYKTRDAFQLLQSAQDDFEIWRESATKSTESNRSILLELVENINSFEQVYQLQPIEEALTGKYESIELLCQTALHLGDIYLAEAYVESLPDMPKYKDLRNTIKQKKQESKDRALRSKQNKLRLQFLLGAIVFLIIVGYSEIYEQKNLAQDNARIAEEKEKMALKHLNDIKTLSASHRSKNLIQEVHELWPALPKTIPLIDKWIEQVDVIQNNMEFNTNFLKEEEKELKMRKQQVDPEFWMMDHRISVLEWEIQLRKQLIMDSALLHSHWKERLLDRKRMAENIEKASIGQKERWKRAIEDIRQSPKYNGLELTPQLGLLPLEVNQQGYWEFAHILSGSIPEKKDNLGNWIIKEDTAIILVLLPENTFWMGSDTDIKTQGNFDPRTQEIESPSHQVHISAFFMSKYELNQAQWLRVMESNPSAYLPGQVHGNHEITLLHPVEHLSYFQGTDVAKRFDLELPTEAQWEYANRAGTNSVYWGGNTIKTMQGKANISDAGARALGAPKSWKYETELYDNHIVHAPIGSFQPNPFGLYDTVGNVWEWCRDHFASYNSPTQYEDGYRQISGTDRINVFRGGGFRASSIHARSSDRYSIYASDYSAYDLGLRLSRSIR